MDDRRWMTVDQEAMIRSTRCDTTQQMNHQINKWMDDIDGTRGAYRSTLVG